MTAIWKLTYITQLKISLLPSGGHLLDAVGEKKGIFRYGHSYVPMDETLIRASLDFSGRPEFVFQGEFTQPTIGCLDTR